MTTLQESEPQSQGTAVSGNLPSEGASPNKANPLTGGEDLGHQAGAEVGDTRVKPAGRTYTQAEWSARESAKDREIAALRRQWQESDARAGSQQRASQELQARETDRRALEEGEITEAEARARSQRRAEHAAEVARSVQVRAGHLRMSEQMEVMGRLQAASDLAQEFGLKKDDLLNDPELKDYPLMREKAWQQYKAKMDADKKGTEQFDSAQVTQSKGAKSYMDRVRSGDTLPSAEEIDRITARYLK